MTIVEFLRARYDEEEAAAREAREGPWALRRDSVSTDEIYSVTREADRGGDSNVFPDVWHDGSNAHAVRHDPARVLREVEAKRRIVDAYPRDPDGWDTSVTFGDWSSCSDSCPPEVLGHVLRLLALPYSDHPDFDLSWRV